MTNYYAINNKTEFILITKRNKNKKIIKQKKNKIN